MKVSDWAEKNVGVWINRKKRAIRMILFNIIAGVLYYLVLIGNDTVNETGIGSNEYTLLMQVILSTIIVSVLLYKLKNKKLAHDVYGYIDSTGLKNNEVSFCGSSYCFVDIGNKDGMGVALVYSNGIMAVTEGKLRNSNIDKKDIIISRIAEVRGN